MVDVWFVFRCLALSFFGASGTVVLALSIHFQVGRWPIEPLGLQPDLFNGTNLGNFDHASNTINATGVYITPFLNYAGITIGTITALLSFPMLILALAKRQTRSSTVFVEILWTSTISAFWLAITIISFMGTLFPTAIGACDGVGLCIEVQVFKLISFVMWLLLGGYWMMLLTLVTVGICRGKRRAFWMSAVTGEFFTPLHSAPGYTNTSSNQLQTRVSSHYGQDDDASVYSTPSRSSRVQPIPLGFGMTSSMSRDAHMVYVDEHEMKPVSIISPRPRLFQTRFSVGSDEGEIANVPLDEEQSVKQDGEKAKPLV